MTKNFLLWFWMIVGPFVTVAQAQVNVGHAAAQHSAINHSRTDQSFSKVKQSDPPIDKPSTSSLAQLFKWIPFEQLTWNQRKNLAPNSCGMYEKPLLPRQSPGNEKNAPIHITADRSRYEKSGISSLTGDVVLRQGDQVITGQHIDLQTEKRLLNFYGYTRLQEPDLLLTGMQGHLDFNKNVWSIDQANYLIYKNNARGHAEKITRLPHNRFIFDKAYYTTCPPPTTEKDNPDWMLVSDHILLNKATGYGTAKNATLKVKGVPVLYIPYISFPIDKKRHSGFLMPSVHSGTSGIELAFPYYFNLAPNYDLLFSPDLSTKRGVILSSRFRYLGDHVSGSVTLSGLPGKDPLKNANPYYHQKRWMLSWQQKFDLTPQAYFNIDYSRASDKHFIQDFRSPFDSNAPTVLQQRIETGYHHDTQDNHWLAKVGMVHYQYMQDDGDLPYNQAPYLTFNGNRLLKDDLVLNYGAQYTHFNRQTNWHFVNSFPDPNFPDSNPIVYKSIYDQGYGLARATGGRWHFQEQLTKTIPVDHSNTTASLILRQFGYHLNNLNQQEVVDDLVKAYPKTFNASEYSTSKSYFIPSFSVNVQKDLIRNLHIFDGNYTQVLIPRIKYLYTPYVKGQEMNPLFDTATYPFNYDALWRDNRFVGYDRVGDANQLSAGVFSSFMDQNGNEKLSFSLGQRIYFSKRKVYISPLEGHENTQSWFQNLNALDAEQLSSLGRTFSPLLTQLNYYFTPSSSVEQNLDWSIHRHLDRYGIHYRYQPEYDKVISLGYQYFNQIDRLERDMNNQPIVDPTSPIGYRLTGGSLKLLDLSFSWPATRQFDVLGQWQYDLQSHRNLSILAGISFDSCCYKIQLFWKSWKDTFYNFDYPKTHSGLLLQIELKGLGQLSSNGAANTIETIKGQPQPFTRKNNASFY